MTLREAVQQNLISKNSVTVLDLSNGQKVNLDQAISSGVMDGTNGDIYNTKTSKYIFVAPLYCGFDLHEHKV
jgi:hypothetical protein